jgi:hypothetical protein
MRAWLAVLTGFLVAGCATNVPESKLREVQRITNTGYYTYQAASSARHR